MPMPLNIKDEETHELARRLARRTGQSMARAVKQAVAEKLAVVESEEDKEALVADLMRIVEEASRLPVLDNRSADEIIGYDEFGLPR